MSDTKTWGGQFTTSLVSYDIAFKIEGSDVYAALERSGCNQPAGCRCV